MAERQFNRRYKREYEYEYNAMKSLDHLNSFLYKLWKLVNDENLSSIHWSGDGEKVVIEHPAEFTADVLNASDKKHFKTQNIASFIRQLNLYGFRRVKDNCGKIPLVFKHENFKQHRQDLLVQIKRKKPKSQALPMIRPSLPTLHSKDVSLKPNIFQPGRSPSFPPYPGLSTCQPYSYFNNTMAGKNISMPYVTPFAVNHGPTFINLGSHSTVYNKSQSSAPFTLKRLLKMVSVTITIPVNVPTSQS